jgi:hypothetical protein
MRKAFVLAVVCIFALSTLAFAAAKTKVAIVKGTPHEVIGDSWEFSMFDFRKRWETNWTAKSEKEIEQMVRKAMLSRMRGLYFLWNLRGQDGQTHRCGMQSGLTTRCSLYSLMAE